MKEGLPLLGAGLDIASKIARRSVPTMMKYCRQFNLDELTKSMEKMKEHEKRRR